MPAPRKASEYGGKSGIIQTVEDGHISLTSREIAMVMRSEGRRDAGIDDTIPDDDAHRAAVDARIRDRETRFNGRTVDGDAIGG